MEISFSKYHGAGNDFIFIDNRENKYILNDKLREKMCRAHFGIGADGVLEIRSSDEVDFKLVYFNSDGSESTLCGNGSRCAIAFAFKIGIQHRNVSSKVAAVPENESRFETAVRNDQGIDKISENTRIETMKYRISDASDSRNVPEYERRQSQHDDFESFTFEACDGIHIGGISGWIPADSGDGDNMFYTDMKDINSENVKIYSNGDIFINTGSPHHVRFLPVEIPNLDVAKEGRELTQRLYGTRGSNVNFVVRRTRYFNYLQDLEMKVDKINGDEGIWENGESENSKTDGGENFQNGSGQQESCDDEKVATHETSHVCLHVRTYERGVDDETLACGTGCVAVAIADYIKERLEKGTENDDEKRENFQTESDVFHISKFRNINGETVQASDSDKIGCTQNKIRMEKRTIRMPGGCLLVTFTVTDQGESLSDNRIKFSDIKLSGPVEHVFDGVCVL
uniref:diaminopimelate epimerase n=1 Tax=Arion vulgaris TaxID=1028688 RepID=A0A0B7A2Q0_9EUPU